MTTECICNQLDGEIPKGQHHKLGCLEHRTAEAERRLRQYHSARMRELAHRFGKRGPRQIGLAV